MKAIVVTDQAAGTAGMTLVERPEPHAAGNDVVVQVHASGFTPGELAWPSTWTDRLGRDRTPSIPGHELAGVVSALGYGTTGLSVGQRVFGLADWTRDGTLAEYVAVEARTPYSSPGSRVSSGDGSAAWCSARCRFWSSGSSHCLLRGSQSVAASTRCARSLRSSSTPALAWVLRSFFGWACTFPAGAPRREHPHPRPGSVRAPVAAGVVSSRSPACLLRA